MAFDRYKILPRAFTALGADAELTATQKVKTRVVKRKYIQDIMDLYGEAFKAEGSMAKYQRAMELVLAKERAGQALFSSGGKGGGRFPAQHSIVVSLVVDDEGDRMLLDKHGLPPSVAIAVDEDFHLDSHEDMKFVWMQQFGAQMRSFMPDFVAATTNDAFNKTCMHYVQALQTLKGVLPDRHIGTLHDRLVAVDLGADERNPEVKCVAAVRAVTAGEAASLAAKGYAWKPVAEAAGGEDAQKQYRAAAQHSRAAARQLSPGLYLGYLGFASSRNGFCVLVPNTNHGFVPAVKLDLPKADCDGWDDAGAAWRWVRADTVVALADQTSWSLVPTAAPRRA